MFDQVLRKDH